MSSLPNDGPASERAYVAIRSWILDGALAPGARLSEVELAERAGVSRTPVRDALRRLEVDGLVARTSSNRAFVHRNVPEEIDEIFRLRALLEGEAAARAAVHADAAAIAVMTAANAAVAAALSRAEPASEFVTANARFHAAIVAAADGPRLQALLAQLVERPVVSRTVRGYSPAALLRSHQDHVDIIAAITIGDAEWARAAMTAHIGRARHAFRAADQVTPTR